MTIHSLAEAFDQYRWKRENFNQTMERLDRVALIISRAVAVEAEKTTVVVAKTLHSVHEVLKRDAGGIRYSLYAANYNRGGGNVIFESVNGRFREECLTSLVRNCGRCQ